MNAASGNPSGFTASIYSSLDPANNLGNLNGADPIAPGIYTYTASNIFLTQGDYYVVVHAASPVADGAFYWNWSDVHGNISGPWTIVDNYYFSPNGSDWTGHVRQNIFQLAIYATPVPEPSAIVLILFSGGMLVFLRRSA